MTRSPRGKQPNSPARLMLVGTLATVMLAVWWNASRQLATSSLQEDLEDGSRARVSRVSVPRESVRPGPKRDFRVVRGPARVSDRPPETQPPQQKEIVERADDVEQLLLAEWPALPVARALVADPLAPLVAAASRSNLREDEDARTTINRRLQQAEQSLVILSGGRRVLQLDDREYRVGDRIEGLLIEEITASSLVLKSGE